MRYQTPGSIYPLWLPYHMGGGGGVYVRPLLPEHRCAPSGIGAEVRPYNPALHRFLPSQADAPGDCLVFRFS